MLRNVGAPFEPDEVTTVQVRPSALPIVRRVMLLALTLWTLTQTWSLHDALRNLFLWWGRQPGRSDGYPIQSTTSVALHVLALVLFVSLGRSALRGRAGKRRGSARVRADERGLSTDDGIAATLLVAREDIASVEVRTDPDLGFAVVVHERAGRTLVVPLRHEKTAHDLAAALWPDHDHGKLVFEGVSDRRARETWQAVLAVALLVGVAVASSIDLVPEHLGRELQARYGDRPYTPLYWLQWLLTFAPVIFGGPAAFLAARPLVRRLRPGRVVVDGAGVSVGERRLAPDDIAGLEAGEGSAVTIALRVGKPVRVAFRGDRPLVERDLFIARVRALTTEQGAPVYPSAETSGVRVAMAPEPETEAAPEEEPHDAQPPRARRRG
jgi:hypothetical protein